MFPDSFVVPATLVFHPFWTVCFFSRGLASQIEILRSQFYNVDTYSLVFQVVGSSLHFPTLGILSQCKPQDRTALPKFFVLGQYRTR